MDRSVGRLNDELRSLRIEIDSIVETLDSLNALTSHTSLGCTTFTAEHGSSVISQLDAEITSLVNRLRNSVNIRDREGNPLGNHTRTINSTNSVLRSYLQKESKEVEDGMVRQYFADDSELVVEPVDFPIEHLQIRIGKGDRASTHAMLRQQNFNTNSLANLLKSNRKKYASMEAEMKSSLERLLLKLGDSNSGPNRWSESATDLGSAGGFLIRTDLNSDYKLLFCPHCSKKLIDTFNQGVRGIVFPPIPKTILDLKVLCTENEHRNHSYEDCIGVDDLEARINQVREQYQAPTHHTEVVFIPNQQLSQSHGDWIWLRHN